MSAYPASKKDGSFPITPPHSMDTYPKDSIRQIAVLFTDIVGSTRYFQTQGAVAGREMLQRHQDLASIPIVEHGGILVKTVGDAVMAYFTDSQEAVKAAIRIQQQILLFNQRLDPDIRIMVRIGIHFGEGIVEDQDIFGNVVNLAAKIIPLAGGAEILISEDVWKTAKDLYSVRYEPFNPPDDKKELEGIGLFRVIWDENIKFNPTANILLYLKPLQDFGSGTFKTLWQTLCTGKATPWTGKIIKSHIQDDHSIVLILNEITDAVSLSEQIVAFFNNRLDAQETFFVLPMQMVIDSGPYIRADKLLLDHFEVPWDGLVPGNVYISSSAIRLIKNKKAYTTDPPFDPDLPESFYRIVHTRQEENKENASPLFLYQNALYQGNHPPCFYCGSKKHPISDCPSKQMDTITHALNKMGYSSMEDINQCYYRFLMESGNEINGSSEKDEAAHEAHTGFYELKYHLQIRLFRNIWDSNEISWDKVKTEEAVGDRGGAGAAGPGSHPRIPVGKSGRPDQYPNAETFQ